LGAYAHQDLPFEQLVAELAPSREVGRNPLVQVMFQLINTPREAWNLPGLEAEPFGSGTGTTRFDLECDLVERDGRLTGGLTFSRDLFDQGRIDRLARQYERLLAEIAQDPTRTISRFEALNAIEPPAAATRSEPSDDVEHVAPRTPGEQVLAEVWCDVLRLERVGVHDNFFDVGGQSLMAIKVVTRVQQRLGVSIPLESVFDRPTIAELAVVVAELGAEHESADDVAAMVAGLSDADVARMLDEMGDDDDRLS
jgi:acyl carrier protein